jgi:hypothetical protein
MATLPNIPVNSATVIGGLAGLALLGYQFTLRTRIESQIHANYRDFKLIDAGMHPQENQKLSAVQ